MRAFLIGVLAFSAVALAQPAPYPKFRVADYVDQMTLSNAIESMAKASYGEGFKEFSKYDFFHGHLLFKAGEKKPFGILFHTQEHPEKVFAPEKRNWITLLDEDFNTADATQLRYSKIDHPDDFYDPRHTIVAYLLDPSKLGFEVNTDQALFTDFPTYQFDFIPAPCEASHIKFELNGYKNNMACLTLDRVLIDY